jgi:hypothetical protein
MMEALSTSEASVPFHDTAERTLHKTVTFIRNTATVRNSNRIGAWSLKSNWNHGYTKIIPVNRKRTTANTQSQRELWNNQP